MLLTNLIISILGGVFYYFHMMKNYGIGQYVILFQSILVSGATFIYMKDKIYYGWQKILVPIGISFCSMAAMWFGLFFPILLCSNILVDLLPNVFHGFLVKILQPALMLVASVLYVMLILFDEKNPFKEG